MRRRTLALAVSTALALGCAAGGDDPDVLLDADCGDGTCDVDRSEGLCSVTVRRRGTYEVEDYYLPHVLACEHYDGEPAALHAQAIAARSYLYNVIAREGSIADSQGDQVFSCGKPPRERHYQAVEDTSGMFLKYDEYTVAGFYVAGALQSGPSCQGGSSDPTNTEWAVTYNSGLSGNDITQTRLGFRSDANPANRGAMSQNGADCLAREGMTYEEIIRFYYGDDIEIAQAVGPCINSPVPDVTDIGNSCASDSFCQERCESTMTETGAVSGMCSAECIWGCPDGSECVNLGTGEGRCAPLAEVHGCDIPGFEAAVLHTAKGKYYSVCAPLALETTCTVAGSGEGECIDVDVTECSGTVHTGACPGGNSIKCCTP